MALREEHIEGVVLPILQTEARGDAIQVHAAVHAAMNATEIDGEPVVEVHPDIIVAGEGEGLAGPGFVAERAGELVGKMKVVIQPLITVELIVDRKERRIRITENTGPGRRFA